MSCMYVLCATSLDIRRFAGTVEIDLALPRAKEQSVIAWGFEQGLISEGATDEGQTGSDHIRMWAVTCQAWTARFMHRGPLGSGGSVNDTIKWGGTV